MNLFKKKKTNEKTIKLSDLIYVLEKYKNIYNECKKEVGSIISENSDQLERNSYSLCHYINDKEFKATPVIIDPCSCCYSYITNTTIRNMITLYAKEDIKEKINMLEQIGDLLSGMYLKYNGVRSIISSDHITEKITSTTSANYISFYKMDEINDTYHIFEKFEKTNPEITINKAKQYNQFIEYLASQKTKKDLFDNSGNLYDIYKGKTLEEIDLINVDFDNKNISGLNISKKPDVRINFDKIVKDVSNCNFNGYNLSKVTFRNFNIQNTDFRNTYATIDLGSCMISYEGKMNPGTLFDENNKFIFGEKKVSQKDVKKLGIKIYKRKM